jgi:hypothetical protein
MVPLLPHPHSVHPIKRRARYTITGALTYEKVVNGFPRYKLPVKQIFKHSTVSNTDSTISTAIFLFNEVTGVSVSNPFS